VKDLLYIREDSLPAMS